MLTSESSVDISARGREREYFESSHSKEEMNFSTFTNPLRHALLTRAVNAFDLELHALVDVERLLLDFSDGSLHLAVELAERVVELHEGVERAHLELAFFDLRRVSDWRGEHAP